jgi:broad specificity phosphatase PhoE
MKWPTSLLFVRHDVSAYNQLRQERERDPFYRQFMMEFELDPLAETTRLIALEVNRRFALGVSDAETPLIQAESPLAVETGRRLREQEELPNVIFVSPYLRTRQTLAALIKGWPELASVEKVYEEERIREQSHGLSNLYNDWRVFQALHPEQKQLYELEGQYWYQWPQGESVPDVRERVRSWMTTFIRDFAGQRILAVSHHLTLLALLANLERWDANEFMRVDHEEKPVNCGVTKYVGIDGVGSNGRFNLDYYNQQLAA